MPGWSQTIFPSQPPGSELLSSVPEEIAQQTVDLKLEPARGIVARVLVLDFEQQVVLTVAQQDV